MFDHNTEDSRESALGRRLAEEIGRGDQSAESELVQQFRPGLRYLVTRWTRDQSLVDDILQETFRIVIERLRGPGLDDPSKLAAFLRQTGRNISFSEVRRRRCAQVHDAASFVEAQDPAPGQLQQFIAREQLALVRRVLDDLGVERDREILYLYFVEECPKQEICERLDLSALHFNRVLYRARERLKTAVRQAESDWLVVGDSENREESRGQA